MGVPIKSIIYDGKEYSLGDKDSGAQISSRRIKTTEVNPQAVNSLVVYLQDYTKLQPPILHTVEYLNRRFTSGEVYRYIKNAMWRRIPDFLFSVLRERDLHEYRVDGDVIDESIDIKMSMFNHKRNMPEEIDVDENKLLSLFVKYFHEIQRYEIIPLNVDFVHKAIAPWTKELCLSPQSSDILANRVAQNMNHYHVKEQPLSSFLGLRYLRTGAVRTIGEKYKRNPMPLLDWGDFLGPALDLLTDSTHFGPREVAIENPSEIAIFAPRVILNRKHLGNNLKLHHLRHALYYACFFELLSPESPIYDEFGEQRRDKVYDTLEELLIKDRIYEEAMPNNITEEFFYKKGLDFFREQNSLDNLEHRSLLATSLYLKENFIGHNYREALTHTAKGHAGILLTPWVFTSVIAFFMGIPPILVPYIPSVMNAGLASQGHGNPVAYYAVKNKIKKCNTPYEELYTLATLGN